MWTGVRCWTLRLQTNRKQQGFQLRVSSRPIKLDYLIKNLDIFLQLVSSSHVARFIQGILQPFPDLIHSFKSTSNNNQVLKESLYRNACWSWMGATNSKLLPLKTFTSLYYSSLVIFKTIENTEEFAQKRGDWRQHFHQSEIFTPRGVGQVS